MKKDSMLKRFSPVVFWFTSFVVSFVYLNHADAMYSVCDRTPAVREEIIKALDAEYGIHMKAEWGCKDITDEHLLMIRMLNLEGTVTDELKAAAFEVKSFWDDP